MLWAEAGRKQCYLNTSVPAFHPVFNARIYCFTKQARKSNFVHGTSANLMRVRPWEALGKFCFWFLNCSCIFFATLVCIVFVWQFHFSFCICKIFEKYLKNIWKIIQNYLEKHLKNICKTSKNEGNTRKKKSAIFDFILIFFHLLQKLQICNFRVQPLGKLENCKKH